MAKRIAFESEADIAKAVIAELRDQGYEVYQEVSVGYGGQRADVVGQRGSIVALVETKTSLSLKLLEQLVEWQGHANYIIGAVPASPAIRNRAVSRFLRAEGIGLWAVAVEVSEHISPKLARRISSRITKVLAPEQRTGEYGAAGTRAGGYWTPFQATCRNLRETVAHNPGIELREALAKMAHHYVSDKSARSALPALIRRGVVQGIRLDDGDGRLRLFPAIELAQSVSAVDPVEGISNV
jgi:hypothetical protein